MRGSAIIFRSTQKSRQNKALEMIEKEIDQKVNWNYLPNFPDIKIVETIEEKKSIGIAQVKEAMHFLQEKPLALEIKVLIIDKAHLLTTEAQNAMLKTLEEPPAYALIFLLAKTENSLLPTIVSRCRKYIANPSEENETLDEKLSFAYVWGLTNGERLDWAEENAKEDKDTIIDILEKWTDEGRGMLSGEQGTKVAKALEAIVKTTDDLENTNVGVRLALEQLLISF